MENEGIQVVKEFEQVPTTLLNSSKIKQVFLNIIINARDAIEKNGTLTIRIRQEENSWIIVDFEDTGAGMDQEILDKIFEPFYTSKGSFGGGTQPGTGIGLSLCYSIVNQHKGKITVKSEVGKGSCFTVTLPIKSKETKRIPIKKLSLGHNGERILVAEKNMGVRDMLQDALGEKGFDVYDVQDGTSAIDLCKKEHFAFAFLDAEVIAEQEKFNLFTEIKHLEPNTKVILMTNRAEDASHYGVYWSGRRLYEKAF